MGAAISGLWVGILLTTKVNHYSQKCIHRVQSTLTADSPLFKAFKTLCAVMIVLRLKKLPYILHAVSMQFLSFSQPGIGMEHW